MRFEGGAAVFTLKSGDNITGEAMHVAVDKLAKDLGFDEFIVPSEMPNESEPHKLSGKEFSSTVVKSPDMSHAEATLKVDKATLAENFGVKERAQGAQRDARIDKAADLGVKLPG